MDGVLTLEYHAICHRLFDVILRLRKQQEDIDNATFDQLGQLAFFFEHTVEH